jgi:DNA polymerase-4
MGARILHVDLDAFFVEVCRQRHLSWAPSCWPGGRRDQRGVVQSASYGARRFGIHAGMPIGQAVRLCPQATFFQGAFPDYRDASRAVHVVLERFSPTVVMASLDEAYLDFAGTERLYPVSLLPVAEQLRDEVRRDTGLDCSIGIGPNRMIAKLASDSAKPRGLMEVRAGWEEGFLAGLPLSAMPGVGPKTAARWAELGLTDVWQVQRVEEAALARLIGPEARALKRRAHGHGGTTLREERLPKSVSRETTLGRDLRDPEELEAILALLTARVAGQLREETLVGRTVTLKLRHDDFRTVTRRHTLEATISRRALRGATFRRRADVRGRNRGVRLIRIAARTRRGGGADSFETHTPPSRQLSAAVDQLREKYGFLAVTRAPPGAKRRLTKPNPLSRTRSSSMQTTVPSVAVTAPDPEHRLADAWCTGAPCCSGRAGTRSTPAAPGRPQPQSIALWSPAFTETDACGALVSGAK